MLDTNVLIGSLVYIFIGILIFVTIIIVLDKVTPWSLHKELIEDENVSLGIIIGCLFISIAIIIAAAIHG
ncbi:DUF350 domain-containing protein [Candidatus Vampirococcus lugosii]|uniref:DUF350 domain-containing protein n=1 Tax=Candidatus Vampirococcus lugosii TaxID=2789015 RepID=A0ABS5QKR9_9BACT|nr:DUF350 domain-containing protein [Candidatus Vampirococcus lugosii]MBS8121825.1 hypothetical protein [Candidatus Vampirococcus lugosii]